MAVLSAILFIFVYIPATFVRESGAQEASNRVMHKMRCELYEHLQHMSARFHQVNKSGELVTRINSDVDQVHSFIWSVATNIWIDAITLCIYLVLMLQINVPLTIVAFVTLPISVIVTKKIRTHIRKNSKKAQQEISGISGYMQERMAGFAVVKLFHMEEYEREQFDDISTSIYRYFKKRNIFSSLGIAITGAFSEVICSIIICLSALVIIEGDMTIGDMIVFYSYLGYLITPLRRFAELNVTYARSIAGIERVYEIMDTKPDVQEKETAITLLPTDPMNISFEDVCFAYDEESDIMNLKNVSFSLKEGEKIALVGSSGCGKSTIVNLMARFYDIDSGKILVAGKDLQDYTLESLYTQMGMVFQDTILFSGTIAENLKYGKPDATLEEMEAAAKAANAYEFIMEKEGGLDHVAAIKGADFSGGQKQRMLVARALAGENEFLLLDDASSALDYKTDAYIRKQIREQKKGITTVTVAQRISSVMQSDLILVLDDGAVIGQGTHKELLESCETYREIYKSQMGLDLSEDKNGGNN